MFSIEDLRISGSSSNIHIKNVNIGHNFDDIHRLSVKRGKPSKEILDEIFRKKLAKSLQKKREKRIEKILD